MKVTGKNGIYANLIADSINESGQRFSTFEWNFHRYILAETNTHRAISKNLQSSRAVPLKSAIALVRDNPAIPVHFGKNQAGMTAKEELSGEDLIKAQQRWQECIDRAIEDATYFDSLFGHKQWASRILEPYTMTKGIESGTNWDNLLWLRNDADAQPEFKVLAECAQECLDKSTPTLLYAHEWHLPYIDSRRVGMEMKYFDTNGEELSLELAQKISASCCAQISYRRLNDTPEKALEIYDKLFSGNKPHMSPTEHQGTPISKWVDPICLRDWPNGVTHVDRNGKLHSGNLTGWIQYRQTLPNNVYGN